MAKIRVLVFLVSLVVVGVFGVFASYYARGYRFDLKTLKFQPNGLLVVKSEPDGASIYVNGELKTATNATLSLPPGTYDIEVNKDGFLPWKKRMVIEKEIITQADVSLFKIAPSLSPITFSGAQNPVISDDDGKIAFVVLPSKDTLTDKIGLWTIDVINFPLGFPNEPKRITDGDLTGSTYFFSPDKRQIMLTTSNGIFLLDTNQFTSQANRINITSKKDVTLADWEKERNQKNTSLTRNLPDELINVLTKRSSDFTFSPDQNMVLYTASASGFLPDNLIKELPGSSTQKQERNIQIGHTYIYDIKEDRNFLITDKPINQIGQPSLLFMPSSRHLLMAEDGKVTIMDYDGTNRQIVYSGSYISPFAFPFTNETKLLILTNLGAASSSANLYTLTVK